MSKRYALVEECDNDFPRKVKAHDRTWMALSKVDEEYDCTHPDGRGNTGLWFDILLAVPVGVGRLESEEYPVAMQLIRVARDFGY